MATTPTYVVSIVADDDPTDRHDIDVTTHVGTSNYDRFYDGLCRKVDWDRYHVDSTEADEAHAKAMAEREARR